MNQSIDYVHNRINTSSMYSSTLGSHAGNPLLLYKYHINFKNRSIIQLNSGYIICIIRSTQLHSTRQPGGIPKKGIRRTRHKIQNSETRRPAIVATYPALRDSWTATAISGTENSSLPAETFKRFDRPDIVMQGKNQNRKCAASLSRLVRLAARQIVVSNARYLLAPLEYSYIAASLQWFLTRLGGNLYSIQ